LTQGIATGLPVTRQPSTNPDLRNYPVCKLRLASRQ